MGEILDSDWSRQNLLRSDWLLLIVAPITTHTSQRSGSVEKSDKVRILSHFPPVMNPLSFFT